MEIPAVDVNTAMNHQPPVVEDDILLPAAAGASMAAAAACTGVATPVAAAQTEGAAVSEPDGGAGGDFGIPKDELMFAVEDGIPKDAAISVGADLACAARAAANGEDNEAVECTVMKRGNYWPYFWAQRLLLVERRSLLYFAGSVPASGATPRGFFRLQQNTRILLSFNRVSLYGRTDTLLVGIFNTSPSAPPVTFEPWCSVSAAHPTLRGSATHGLVSPAPFPGKRNAQVTPKPLHVLQQQQQDRQQLGVASPSGEQRGGDEGFLRFSFQSASPYENADMLSSSAPYTARSTLLLQLSLFLAPFRWMLPVSSSSSGVNTDQSTVREAAAQHLHAGIAETSIASPGSVAPFTTTREVSPTRCSTSSPFSCFASYSPSLHSSSSSSSSVLPASVLFQAASRRVASPSFASATTSSRASACKNLLSSSTDTPSSASVSAESGSTLLSLSARDGHNELPCSNDLAESSDAADSDYSDAEDDHPSSVPCASSAEASSPATAALPSLCSVASSDAASVSNGGTHSPGSFFSLPSTPSAPLRSRSSSSSHSSVSVATSPCPSNSCLHLSTYETSTCALPAFRHHHSSASHSLSPVYSASHTSPSSSSSSVSSFSSSLPPTVASSSGFWATATSSPVSKAGFRVSPPSSAPASSPVHALPSRSRVLQTSPDPSPAGGNTPSSSRSLRSHYSCRSCKRHTSSPLVRMSRTTSSEKPEARCCENGGIVVDETQQELVAHEKYRLHQEEVRLQEDHGHMMKSQQESQPLEQGHGHLTEAGQRSGVQLDLPSDAARISHDCWLTSPAFTEASSERFPPATQTGNLRRGASPGIISASCSDSDGIRRGRNGHSGAPVVTDAPEPPVILICTQETLEREFNRASKPKFLFEFADHKQQHRVSCAIARCILRIRREERRKQQKQEQQQKQQLHDGLRAQGLYKWQQEHHTTWHYGPLHVAELPQQRLPRQTEELQEAFSYVESEKLSTYAQQQHWQGPLGLQHVQTKERILNHTSCVSEQRDSQKRPSVQGPSSRDLGRTVSAAGGRISSTGASITTQIGKGCATATPGSRTEESAYMPRLLRGSADAKVRKRNMSQNVAESPLRHSNTCATATTATGRSVRAKTGLSVAFRQGRRIEESVWRQPLCPRNCGRPLFEGKWHSRGSEKICMRESRCRPFFLRGTTSDASADRRCHSEENIVFCTSQQSEREDPIWENRGQPDIETSHLQKRGRREHRGRTRKLQLRETETPQFRKYLKQNQQHNAAILRQESHRKMPRKVPEASQPHVMENCEAGKQGSLQEYEHNDIRLVRALMVLQRGRKQPLFQVGSAICCRSDSEINTSHARIRNYIRTQRSVPKAASRMASDDALFYVAESCALQKIERSCDPGNEGGDRPSRGSSAVRQPAAPAGSESYSRVSVSGRGVAHAVYGLGGIDEVTDIEGLLTRQTQALAAVSSKEHQKRQQTDTLEQTEQGVCDVSEQALHQVGCALSLQTQQSEGGSSPWRMQQRVRAVDMLLLEQREQLERLRSVVNFLLREREMQLRFGYQVDDAELQQHWEEERRRFEVEEKQRSPLAAACTIQRKLNAYEERHKHRDNCEGHKGLAERTEEQTRGLPGEREAAMGESHFGNVENGEVSSVEQAQTLTKACQNRKWRKCLEKQHAVSWNSPLQNTAVSRKDVLSNGEQARKDGTQGDRDIDSCVSAEGRFLTCGPLNAACAGGKSFLDIDRSGAKRDSSVIAALSLEERKPRNSESDAEDQEKQRKKHPATPREPPVIFRISTPPVHSGESDVDKAG